jgi:hypothetical protein
MKTLATLLLLFALVDMAVAAPQSAKGRTIGEIDVIPAKVLQRSVSPKFYQSLLRSPIDGWVVVRGSLHRTTLSGLKVIHSEPSGLHDHLALQRARDVRIAGNYTIENPNLGSPVLVHLLLYKIADGAMALSFAHLDGPGGEQAEYYGCARLAVLKNDGKWVEIKGPESLDGKGIAVRRGIKNDLATSMKLERLTTGAEATNMGAGTGGR